MRLRTKILLAILLTLLAGDVLGTLVVQNRLAEAAQREADTQATARAQQVRALYQERGATLVAQGETISLYPAVIAALAGNNPAPLRTWSSQVANLQGTSVTVTDASGHVVSRGHAPEQSGDDLSGQLGGLRAALAGQKVSGVEAGDELGPALRGYVPVRQDGLSGPIVGAVMLADPLDNRFLSRLSGADAPAPQLQLDAAPLADGCTTSNGLASVCHIAMASPVGQPAASLQLDVPLSEVERGQADAQRGLWLVSFLVLVLGAIAAWFLARSLTRPLAHLTAASERIAGGLFDQPVNVTSHDEVGTLASAFERMRERVAEMTEQLRDERDVLDAVLGSTGDGILMVNPRGKTVVANQVWTDFVGGATLEAAGSLAYSENPDVTFDALARRWLTDAEHLAIAQLEDAEPYRCFRVYSAPVRFHRTGPILGRIFVLRDVTRETEAERMRSALLATVSHELRSPLTAISGYTETLLRDGPWDEVTQREFLEVIALSASRLSGLVDNLLDAATLDAGVLRLEREPVRVERIAEHVLAQRRLLATSWTLHLETRPSLPLADADPIRVEQVLANLVDNAIKYSPRGGPIRVRVWPTHDGQVGVSVSDRGNGIPPEAISHLFERFYRVEGAGAGVKGAAWGCSFARAWSRRTAGRSRSRVRLARAAHFRSRCRPSPNRRMRIRSEAE